MENIYEYEETLVRTNKEYIKGRLNDVKFCLTQRTSSLKSVNTDGAIYLLFHDKIKNLETRELYIGKTDNIYRRLTDHRGKDKPFAYAFIIQTDIFSSSDIREKFEFKTIEYVKNLIKYHKNWNKWKFINTQMPKDRGDFKPREKRVFCDMENLFKKTLYLLDQLETDNWSDDRVGRNVVSASRLKTIPKLVNRQMPQKSYVRNVTKFVCPRCAKIQDQDPSKEWPANNSWVSYFMCSCGKSFHHHITRNGKEWYNPKPKS